MAMLVSTRPFDDAVDVTKDVATSRIGPFCTGADRCETLRGMLGAPVDPYTTSTIL
jgi:hypothetical protein